MRTKLYQTYVTVLPHRELIHFRAGMNLILGMYCPELNPKELQLKRKGT